MKNLFLFAILFLSFTAFGQVTSKDFRDAAEESTKRYNNENKKCNLYAKKLYRFLQSNADKHDINSYKMYLYEAYSDMIGHDDYDNGNTAISENGKHYVIEIDGYIFDNHHPRGQLRRTWEKKLESRRGKYPNGFHDRDEVEKPLSI